MEKQIIPAVLENSLQNFEESIKKIENSKINFSHIQIDIMDGKFVPNFSFDQNDEHLNLNINTNLKFELHLMTEHPLKDMIRWQTETNVFRVLFHIESSDDPQECIDFCLDNGWQVGIVINPSTEINKVIPFTEKIDVLMFMTVIPGKQGQKMMPEIEKNIKEYKNLIKDNKNRNDFLKIIYLKSLLLYSGHYLYETDDDLCYTGRLIGLHKQKSQSLSYHDNFDNFKRYFCHVGFLETNALPFNIDFDKGISNKDSFVVVKDEKLLENTITTNKQYAQTLNKQKCVTTNNRLIRQWAKEKEAKYKGTK